MIFKIKLILGITLLLSSCQSFNSVHYNSYQLSDHDYVAHHEKEHTTPKPVHQTQTHPPTKPTTTIVYKCSKYILPKLPDLPKFPVKELSQVDPNDLRSMDVILAAHIQKLIDHEKSIKKLINDSYKQYSLKCN